MELVNIILSGIITFTKKSFDDHLRDDEVQKGDLDHFNLLRKLEIPRIEIEDPYEKEKEEKRRSEKAKIIQDKRLEQNVDIGEIKLEKEEDEMITRLIEEDTADLTAAIEEKEKKKTKIIINESVEVFEHAGYIF